MVDNASEDGSAAAVRDAASPTQRDRERRRTSASAPPTTAGWPRRAAPYVLILNSDAEVRPGAVEALVARAGSPSRGGRRRPAHAGRRRRDPGLLRPAPHAAAGMGPAPAGARRPAPAALRPCARAEALAAHEHEPAWVSASCLLARREALAGRGRVRRGVLPLRGGRGPLPPAAARRAGRILFTPAAEVVHHLGRSMARTPGRARLEYHRSHLRYYRKHNGPRATACSCAATCSSPACWAGSARLGPGGSRTARRERRHRGRCSGWRWHGN